MKTNREIFECIIRAWARRTNPADGLTLNQLANIAFGSGNSQNSRKVGSALNEYKKYFIQPDKGYKWCVAWNTVFQEHPLLVPQNTNSVKTQPNSSIETAGSLVDEMLLALDDEVKEVKIEAEKNPIRAIGAKLLTRADDTYFYECEIETDGELDLAIPEGAQVTLKWRSLSPGKIEWATLLSFDSASQIVIIGVESEIPKLHQTTPFLIMPRLEALIRAVFKSVRLM